MDGKTISDMTDADLKEFFNARGFYPENISIGKQPEFYAAIRDLCQIPAGYAMVPIEPTRGKLVSMAIRSDHALGMPGYYDQNIFGKAIGHGLTHAQRLESTISRMRQLHEEVVGAGFYRPEREDEYVDIADASLGAKEGE